MRRVLQAAVACLILPVSIDSPAAAQAPPQARFVSMAIGPGRACGVDEAGGLACWGQDANGFARAPLLGASDGAPDQCTAYDKTFRCSRTPLRVAVPAAVKEVAVGNMHSCALAVDGRVYCWGDNSDGALGAPQRGLRTSASPRLVTTPVRFTTIAGWHTTTCATTADGVAYCWGLNDHAQGGARREDCGIYKCIQTPTPVGGSVRFTRVSVGEYRACGVSTNGGAYCWGMAGPPSLGSLGAAVTGEESAAPVRVALPEPVTGVSVGSYHACAVGRSGQAWCWGEGSFGDLGNGATSGSVTPVAIAGGHRFAMVSAGARVSCGLDADGFLWCWGRNNWGQLGTGRTDMQGHAEPVRVPGDRRYRSVAVHEAVCAVDVDGKAWCWGANGWGETGSGPLGSEPLCLSAVVRAACSSRPLPVLAPMGGR